MVFKIAKAELRTLFYSPVAWFLTIAFLVQCAYFYTTNMYMLARTQDAAIENMPTFKDWGSFPLTALFFSANGDIFSNVLYNLYLFVPLLTMGLIGREISNGTIKLLFSSPIQLRKIVLGKYLAVMIYNLLLVLIVGIFLVTGAFNIRSVDYGLLLSAALGFYLLTCAYTAIGLFMSSLTTYQIVSAIGTFLIIFILSRIGGLWQQYDFIRDLTYFLFLSGRTEKMLKGLITSKDVIYFAVVVYMFVSFTLIKLRSGRESKPWYIALSRYMVVIVSALLVGYISSRPRLTGYWDTTANQLNTIHKRTQQLIKELDKEPLEVTLYTNLLCDKATYGLPAGRNDYLTGLWEQYQRFKPDIDFKYVYYYNYVPGMDGGNLLGVFPGKTVPQMAKEMAKGYKVKLSKFMPPDVISKLIDLEPENYRLVMQLKYKGRTEMLRTFSAPNIWPGEQNVAAALKRLTHPVPKIAFITGHYERSMLKKGEREYMYHTGLKEKPDALINLGFDLDTLSLDSQDIPAGITALVLADPKTSLSATCQAKISQYLSKGGNMFILGEPGKQDILNPVLRQLGVELMNGTLVEPTSDEMAHMVKPYVTEAAVDLAEEPILLKLKEAYQQKNTSDSFKVIMPGVAAMAYTDSNEYVKKPIALTVGARTWIRQGALVTDSADIVYNPQAGDLKGSFPTILQLTRQANNKQQRIIICSDADYISNLRVLTGEPLARAFYSWFDEGAFPIYTPRPNPRDNLFTITGKGAYAQMIIYLWVLPGLVLLTGALLLIRRKRK